MARPAGRTHLEVQVLYSPGKVLDELDRELARRGHAFVRYADDCNTFLCSRAAI